MVQVCGPWRHSANLVPFEIFQITKNVDRYTRGGDLTKVGYFEIYKDGMLLVHPKVSVDIWLLGEHK